MEKFFNLIKRNIRFIAIVTVLCIIASNITYAFVTKINEKKNNTDVMTYDEYIELTASDMGRNSSDGDVNVDGGGGGNNTQGGTGRPDTILDNERDEGVRVTLVDAETYARISVPIDFANNPRQPIDVHFGKEYKLWYIQNPKVNIKDTGIEPYTYKTPKIPLPKIVGGNINKIKAYFGSEAFIRDFSGLTGVSYENLTSGKYKFLLEPVGYPKIGGKE